MSRKKRKKARSMGHALSNAHKLIFCREFRFTLKGKYLAESFIKKVNMDLVNKLLYISIYQVYGVGSDVPGVLWLEDMRKNNWDEELVLTTYDGLGEELYQYTFKGLTLKGHDVNYEYASSNEANDNFIIGFKEYERENLTSLPHDGWEAVWQGSRPANDPLPQWRVAVIAHGKDVERPINIEKRPTCKIEETPIKFLNSTTWVPGRAIWEPFKFSMKKEDDIVNLLTKTNELILRFYQEGVLVESWVLQDGFLNKHNYVEGECHVDYEWVYSSASYKKL
jgi:hypothetical protein